MEKVAKEDAQDCIGPALTIDCLSKQLDGIPEPKYVFRGIPIPSIGCVFGPSKSGKTTLVENLLLSVAAGKTEFLGDPIQSENRRVLFVGLEEYCRARTSRNMRQMAAYCDESDINNLWRENVFVIDDSFPRYLTSESHWEMLDREIERIKPGFVVLDSLTRLTVDPIEDSSVATKLMRRLRELAYRHDIVLILIHHTQKMENRPITLSTLAGSRVVGQEVDFLIGVNRSTNNVRYLKDVAYRYYPDDSDKVLKFSITDQQLIEANGYVYENEILSSAMGPAALNDSDQLLLNYLQNLTGDDPSIIFRTGELYEGLINTQKMSKPTLHAALKRLENSGQVEKVEKGTYRLILPS